MESATRSTPSGEQLGKQTEDDGWTWCHSTSMKSAAKLAESAGVTKPEIRRVRQSDSVTLPWRKHGQRTERDWINGGPGKHTGGPGKQHTFDDPPCRDWSSPEPAEPSRPQSPSVSTESLSSKAAHETPQDVSRVFAQGASAVAQGAGGAKKSLEFSAGDDAEEQACDSVDLSIEEQYAYMYELQGRRGEQWLARGGF